MFGTAPAAFPLPSPSRDITTFPFPPTLKSKILNAGFKDVRDFDGMRPVELAKELKVSNEEAMQILRTIKDNSADASAAIEGQTAFEMIHKRPDVSIRTLCEDVDKLLGNGIPVGQLTEFCGVPGIGKTQMGMQLAVSVQIPEMFGGPGGECVYIDTEGSFVVDRVKDMGEAIVSWLKESAAQEQAEGEEAQQRQEALDQFSVESILSHIYYYRVHDYIEQVALLNTLPAFFKEHPTVRLLVIDSITFHFRGDFKDYALRTRLLNSVAQTLMSMAEEYGLAVVLVNQVTTKVSTSGMESAQLAPALGQSWAHNCTNRIVLYWGEGHRNAYLMKSPSMAARTVPYIITVEGIRAFRYQD